MCGKKGRVSLLQSVGARAREGGRKDCCAEVRCGAERCGAVRCGADLFVGIHVHLVDTREQVRETRDEASDLAAVGAVRGREGGRVTKGRLGGLADD